MKLKFAVTVMAVVTFACGRPDSVNDAGGQCFGLSCPTAGGSAGGSAGGTSAGGGAVSGGGTATGGGAAGGAGGGVVSADCMNAVAGSIRAARCIPKYPALVSFTGVVVTAIGFSAPSNPLAGNCKDIAKPTMDADPPTKGTLSTFWVADPLNPKDGIFINKFRCDPPYDYAPVVGDILDIKGYIQIESRFTDRESLRTVVKSQFNVLSGTRPAVCSLASTPPCQELDIKKTGTMAALAAASVPNTFGRDGGLKSEFGYVGARITIAGPLTIADPSPLEMKRISAVPNDDRYFGFKLNNGILVNNFRTFAPNDAGPFDNGKCDYRVVVLDGGMVSFPNGLSGVWDTYAHTPCEDGGIGSGNACRNDGGVIPGTSANFTNVLYPTECADFAIP
jgi:hypothetical protein